MTRTPHVARVLVAGLAALVLPLAACGGDEADTTTTTADSTEQPAGGTDAPGSADADIQAFCDGVREFAELTRQVLADPLGADPGEIAAMGESLSVEGRELAERFRDDPAAMGELNACVDQLSDIGP